jgi:hypothetical protein
MNGLMVAFAFTLPYHVMRVAHAAGVRVHVFGGDASRGLKMSRCCRAYHEMPFAGDPEALLAEIGEVVRAHAIDIIFPSDDVSTRLLAALAGRLPAPCVPVPDLATFDLLNDKWNFTRFCEQNGIRAPQGRLFDNLLGLRRALDSVEIALPLTIKPTMQSALLVLDLSGGDRRSQLPRSGARAAAGNRDARCRRVPAVAAQHLDPAVARQPPRVEIPALLPRRSAHLRAPAGEIL